MIHAIKLVRTTHPPPTQFSSPLQSHIGRKTSCVRFIQATSDHQQPENMNKDETPVKKTGDVMTESFGEGYATRSDEEGFGGIYGGNQYPPPEDPGENNLEFDKSQGSEVKEKEEARHQPNPAA